MDWESLIICRIKPKIEEGRRGADAGHLLTGKAPAHVMRSTTFKKSKLDMNVCFRITLDQYHFLEDLSKKYHCTIPQMLRIIISHEMEKIKSEHS